MVDLINAVAWILCIVMAVLLFGDFIRTELYFAGEKKAREAEKEASGHGSDE